MAALLIAPAACASAGGEPGRGSLDGAIAEGTVTFCQGLHAGEESSYAEVVGLSGEAVAAAGAADATIELIGVEHESSGFAVEFAVLVSRNGAEPPPLAMNVRPEIDATERELEFAYLPTEIRLARDDYASVIAVATLPEDGDSELGRTLVSSVNYRVGDEAEAMWPVAVGYWVARSTDPGANPCDGQPQIEMQEFRDDQ